MSASSQTAALPSMSTIMSDLMHFLTHPMQFVHARNAHTARPAHIQQFHARHPHIVAPAVNDPPLSPISRSGEEETEGRRTTFIRHLVAMARHLNLSKKKAQGAAVLSMTDSDVEQLFGKLHKALIDATNATQKQQKQMQEQRQAGKRPVTSNMTKVTDQIPDDVIMECIAFVVSSTGHVLESSGRNGVKVVVDLPLLRMQTILLQLLLSSGERILPMLLVQSEYVTKWITPVLQSVQEQKKDCGIVLRIYAAHTLQIVSFMVNRYEVAFFTARREFVEERERRRQLQAKKEKKGDANGTNDNDYEKYGELIDDKEDLDMFDKDRMEKAREKKMALKRARELEEKLKEQEHDDDKDAFDEEFDENLLAMKDVLFTIPFTDLLANTAVATLWSDDDDALNASTDICTFVLERSTASLAISALQEMIHVPKIEYRSVELCLMFAKSAVGTRMIPTLFGMISVSTQGGYKKDLISTSMEIISTIAQTVVCCTVLEESGAINTAVELLVRLTFGNEYGKDKTVGTDDSAAGAATTETENGEATKTDMEDTSDNGENTPEEKDPVEPTPFITEYNNHFLNHVISVICYVIGMSGCNYKKIARKLYQESSIGHSDESALLRALMTQLKRAAFVPSIAADPTSNFKLTVYSALASMIVQADADELFEIEEQEQIRLASLIAIDLQISGKGSYYEQKTRTGTGLFSSPWVQYYGAVALLRVVLEKISGDERASPFLRTLLTSNALSLLKNVAIDWKKPKHLRNTQKTGNEKTTAGNEGNKKKKVSGAGRRKPAVDLKALRAQQEKKRRAEEVAKAAKGGKKGKVAEKKRKEEKQEENEKAKENNEEDIEITEGENGVESEHESDDESDYESAEEEEEEEEEEDNEPYVPGQDEPYYFKYWVQPSQFTLNTLVQVLKKDTDEINTTKAAEQLEKDRSLMQLVKVLEQSIEKRRPSESSTSSFKDLKWILYLVVAILVLPYIYRFARSVLHS